MPELVAKGMPPMAQGHIVGTRVGTEVFFLQYDGAPRYVVDSRPHPTSHCKPGVSLKTGTILPVQERKACVVYTT